MTESEKIPGWRISEEALRSIASEISAGKTLVPESWPNQSRVAVLLSFDVHTQTWELMNGARPSLSDVSRGEYAARVGLGRDIDLLDDFEIPASFFVPRRLIQPPPVELEQPIRDVSLLEMMPSGRIDEPGFDLIDGKPGLEPDV